MNRINSKVIMNMKNCYLLVYLVGTIFFASQTIFAQGKNSGDYDEIDDFIVASIYSDYLVGLDKVKSFINGLPKELEENGVTEDQLQTEAELRLRRAGLYNEEATSYISINVAIEKSNNYSVGYNLKFFLIQAARLERNNLSVPFKAWERTNSGVSEKNRIQTDIRQRVGKYIDKFIEDLRAASSQTAKKNTPAQTDKQVIQQSHRL